MKVNTFPALKRPRLPWRPTLELKSQLFNENIQRALIRNRKIKKKKIVMISNCYTFMKNWIFLRRQPSFIFAWKLKTSPIIIISNHLWLCAKTSWKMANIAAQRIRREFKEVIRSEEVIREKYYHYICILFKTSRFFKK